MGDDLKIGMGTSPDNLSPVDPRGLIPTRTVVSGADSNSEKRKQTTINEAVDIYAKRHHFLRVLEESRILFDPKQLPGVTPQESLDFLLKGLKIEDSNAEAIRSMMDKKGQEIREDFPGFIEGMRIENEDRTVAGIWDAADADSFTKMALQWKIQKISKIEMNGIRHKDPRSIKEDIGPIVDDLKKLDVLLKELKGSEIFLQYKSNSDFIDFMALTTGDGKGVGFIQQGPSSPYREVLLGGRTASKEQLFGQGQEQRVTSHLTIPFRLKDVLRSKAPESWSDDRNRYSHGRILDPDFWRSGKYGLPFALNNPFPGIIADKELTELREKDGSGFGKSYDALKAALKQSSRELG